MMEFLDLAFPRRKDKNAILNVFKKNECQEINLHNNANLNYPDTQPV